MTIQELRDLIMDLPGDQHVTISVRPPNPPIMTSSGDPSPTLEEIDLNLYGHELPVEGCTIHYDNTGVPVFDRHGGICLQSWIHNMRGPVLGNIVLGETISYGSTRTQNSNV